MNLRWPLFLLPPGMVAILFFGIPFAVFASYGFFEARPYGRIGTDLTLENITRFFSDPFFAQVTQRSLSISLQVVFFSLLLAYPTAYFVVRTRAAWVKAVISVVFISSFVAVVIRSLGWVIILRNTGPVNQSLLSIGAIDTPLTLLNNDIGVVIGIVQFVLPLAILSLVSVIQTIPRSYEDAARSLGARPFRVVWRVILPLSLPGLASLALLIFSLTMSTFTTVVILGGGRVLTLPLLIYQEIIQKVNYPFASAISLLLVSGVFVVNVGFGAFIRALTPGNRETGR